MQRSFVLNRVQMQDEHMGEIWKIFGTACGPSSLSLKRRSREQRCSTGRLKSSFFPESD